MLLEQKVISIFEYYLTIISGQPDFKVKLHSREEVAVKNFCKFLFDKYGKFSIGPNWWFEYFTFQFEHWRDKQTRLGKGMAQISWVIGKKAFDRWMNKSEDYWYFCTEGLLKFNPQIKRSEIIEIYENSLLNSNKRDFKIISIIEEIEKKRFHNTDQGFTHCMTASTLFHHRSKLCILCKHKSSCKKLLKDNYSKIYEERGYEI